MKRASFLHDHTAWHVSEHMYLAECGPSSDMTGRTLCSVLSDLPKAHNGEAVLRE